MTSSQRSRGSVCWASASRRVRSRSARACEATTTLTSGAVCDCSACTAGSLLSGHVRVLAVGNMYPPHHFGGYEIVWRSAMRHLERHGHAVRVLTTDLDTGATEADDPNVRRELRWYWRGPALPPPSPGRPVRAECPNTPGA